MKTYLSTPPTQCTIIPPLKHEPRQVTPVSLSFSHVHHFHFLCLVLEAFFDFDFDMISIYTARDNNLTYGCGRCAFAGGSLADTWALPWKSCRGGKRGGVFMIQGCCSRVVTTTTTFGAVRIDVDESIDSVETSSLDAGCGRQSCGVDGADWKFSS